MVKVWSELPEPNTPNGYGKDCLYSSGLMALVDNGKVNFPLGIYQTAEREGLERSDSRPDETGATVPDLITAIKNRYGIIMKTIKSSILPDALNTPGIGMVVVGTGSALPANARFGFTGNHAIFVKPVGNGYSDVYNPLQKTGAAPIRVPNEAILKFHNALGGDYPTIVEQSSVTGDSPGTGGGNEAPVTGGNPVSDGVDAIAGALGNVGNMIGTVFLFIGVLLVGITFIAIGGLVTLRKSD